MTHVGIFSNLVLHSANMFELYFSPWDKLVLVAYRHQENL